MVHPTATPGPRLLTKREFLAGVQCHKQLWWRVHDPEPQELLPDPSARALVLGAGQLRTLARDHILGGQLIGFRHQDPAARVEATGSAMASGATVLYDAMFARDGIVAQVDILQRCTDGWILIDVVLAIE